jgi:hypothetical protein
MIHAAGARCASSFTRTLMSAHQIYRSLRSGIGLDPPESSGRTMLATECIGRLARVIKLDPFQFGIAIRRWAQITSIPGRHKCGLTLIEPAAKRRFHPAKFERVGQRGSQEA